MERQLPIELCHQVISHLPRHTLYRCFYVCKAWQALAVQAYYQEINISSRNIIKLREYISSKSFSFLHGSYVKCISFGDEFSDSDSTQTSDGHLTLAELEQLLSFTPNLRRVDFSQLKSEATYITLFRQLEINIPIEEFVSTAQGYGEEDESYFALCYRYRNSLNHMYAFYNYYNEMYEGTPIYLLLPEFTRLTHLTFCNDYDPDLLLFDIMELCPNLIYLRYTSYALVPDSAAERLTDILQKYDATDVQTLSPLPHNQYLEHLEVNVPILIAPLIKYITRHTSPHLKTIRVKMMDDYLFDWIQNTGMHDVLQLAKRMSLAKSARIYSCPSEDIERQPIDGLLKMTQFFQIANTLKGNRNLYCSFSCSDVHINEYAIGVYHGYHLSLNYMLSSEDWNDNNGLYSVLNTPDRSISGIGFEIINSFKLRMEQKAQMPPINFMGFVFNNCPQLDHYEAFYWKNDFLIGCGRPSLRFDPKRTSSHISKINIKCDSSLRDLVSQEVAKYLHPCQVQYF